MKYSKKEIASWFPGQKRFVRDALAGRSEVLFARPGRRRVVIYLRHFVTSYGVDREEVYVVDGADWNPRVCHLSDVLANDLTICVKKKR